DSTCWGPFHDRPMAAVEFINAPCAAKRGGQGEKVAFMLHQSGNFGPFRRTGRFPNSVRIQTQGSRVGSVEMGLAAARPDALPVSQHCLHGTAFPLAGKRRRSVAIWCP